MTNRISVAVLYGGRSSEHSVSCVSAGAILAHLDPQVFDVHTVGISRRGTWYRGEQSAAGLTISERTLPEVAEHGTRVALSVDANAATRLVFVDGPAAGETWADIDVVLPVLHGPFGEDGTIQGLCEIAGVPYVGSGVLASAAAMDKEFTKKLLAAADIPVGRQVVLRPGTDTLSAAEQTELGLPVFVKPARGGSSIGVNKVSSWPDLAAAIAQAREHDPKVIVEAAIVGREIECGVLQLPDGSLRASVAAEIHLPVTGDHDVELYDFDTKYLDDVTIIDLPAAIPAAAMERIQELAIQAFTALDCRGLARVDFFLTEAGPLINEINTFPGFTSTSMYPQLWAETGIGYGELLATLIHAALAVPPR